MKRRSFLAAGLGLPIVRRARGQAASQDNLEGTLRKVNPDLDDFPTEKFHDRVAPLLAQWSARLLASPREVQAIANSLADGFLGSPLQPSATRVIRPDAALEVRRVSYSPRATLGRDAFLSELEKSWSGFSHLTTADFQISAIDGATTRVRYELVGTGPAFHREQRVGAWDLEWTEPAPGRHRIHRWLAGDETRSRSAHPWYADITEHAFGRNASWAGQMAHGIDYWRTILDAASGIDIYGHNGVAVGDIDGDGLDDIYVCQPAGLPNRLYQNRADGTFADITESSGVGLLDNTACALVIDVNNDGLQDLVVVCATGPVLFLNEGGGKFRRKPDAFQFANPPQGTFTGAAAADYDRDGWLDIYFCLYTYYQGTGQYKYPTPYYAAENGPPNFLVRNQRNGTFRDVTAESGLNVNNTRYSFCCGWGDSNGDGWPDLYVVNDFGLKNLYRNNGDGTFTDIAAEAGVQDAGAGMSVSWLDYDNDGREDLYVANMWTAAGERISRLDAFQRDADPQVRALYRKHAMGNSLFRSRGDGGFHNATTFDGGGMGRWSWSSDAWDFDHDGFPDLYIANGMISGALREDLNSFFWRQVVAGSPRSASQSPDYEQAWNAVNELIRADHSWSGFERNVFYANNRDGTFADVSGAVDLDFVEDGRAFALADFDRDGRLELLLKNRNAPQLRLLKNVVPELPPSVAFRLRGVQSNRDAIGAAITIGHQTRRIQAGSGFLSQHSKELFFGLGSARGPISVSIRWPSGTMQELRDLPLNHRIWVEEGAQPSRMEAFAKAPAPVPSEPQPAELLPVTTGTWLLVPVPAPLSSPPGKPMLIEFPNADKELTAVFSILYRYLFDRRRDMSGPVSFLINAHGEIVKVYTGNADPRHVQEDMSRIPRRAADFLTLALPFRGNFDNYAYGRNNLSLGSVFFERGLPGQAEAFFLIALRDDPASAEAQYGIGSVYLQRGQNAEARASFEQAVKLKASYPDTLPNAWNNLGLLAARDGRTEEAVACFKEALRHSPGYWTALENLGNAYRQQKQWDAAREILRQAVAARPKDPEANYSLAMVFAQTDDTTHAYEYLQKALQFRPRYPEALNNLGILLLRTRKRDEAVTKFEECIRVAPGFDQSYLNLARVYSLEGAPDKARSILRDLLVQRPDHALAKQMLDQLR